MSRKLTTEDFIKTANEVHNSYYDYSKCIYLGAHTKVEIICPLHGSFWQKPNDHVKGQGCYYCGVEKRSNKTRKSKEQFIIEANKTHNNFYDYSKIEYINTYTKICIICPIHGEFWTTPSIHLGGSKCPKCFISSKSKIDNIKDKSISKVKDKVKKFSHKWFIEKVSILHNYKYNYFLTDYKGMFTKVTIICPIHGIFEQEAQYHARGSGCPKCKNDKTSERESLTQKQWLERAKEIHGDKYDYFLLDYKDSRAKVKIVCPKHGVFEQLANSHLQGYGCPKCKYEILPQNQPMTQDEYIRKANKVHYNKYNYSKSKYSSWNEFITIICPNHGEFEQRAGSHLQGFGCPNCATSKGENLIQNYLYLNNIKGLFQYKFENCKYKNSLPFDFYLPDYNLCIEYDGTQHYTSIEYFGGQENLELIQLKDSIKTQYCIDNKIELIRIPYWDIDNIESILDKRFK